MAENKIERDEENNRAIVWLPRKGTLEPYRRGSLRVLMRSYIDLDDEIIKIINTHPKTFYANYQETLGTLPYAKDNDGQSVQDLVWRYKRGKIPPDKNVLDHVNGLRHDNRLENLNPVTDAENRAKARKPHEIPPNDPDGTTKWDIYPQSDKVKDENGNAIGFENVRHSSVYVNNIFMGSFIHTEFDASRCLKDVAKLMLNEPALSRKEVIERITSSYRFSVDMVEHEIQRTMEILKWKRPDFV